MNSPDCKSNLKKVSVKIAGAKKKALSFQCPKCDYFEFEQKSSKTISEDFDERYIYSDKELVKGVKQSMKELKGGKGRVFKTNKEIDKYLKEL